jgi:hypothetical protein
MIDIRNWKTRTILLRRDGESCVIKKCQSHRQRKAEGQFQMKKRRKGDYYEI